MGCDVEVQKSKKMEKILHLEKKINKFWQRIEESKRDGEEMKSKIFVIVFLYINEEKEIVAWEIRGRKVIRPKYLN